MFRDNNRQVHESEYNLLRMRHCTAMVVSYPQLKGYVGPTDPRGEESLEGGGEWKHQKSIFNLLVFKYLNF